LLLGGLLGIEVIMGIAMLPFTAAFLYTFSVIFSSGYGSIYSAHERFWTFCWQASRAYDYPTFSTFVESKLMNKYAISI
jgi:hypothetical protein